MKTWLIGYAREAKKWGYNYLLIEWSGIGQSVTYCKDRPSKTQRKNAIEVIKL